VSSSPNQRPTTSLNPRVAAYVAEHDSPGILFSQSARRARRFRHQTNSFSFDESERSNAVYEQDRVSSSSTTGSRPLPSSDVSLHEELQGSSLDDSEFSDDTPHRTPLQLPPPFSTTPRIVSAAGTLPLSSTREDVRLSSNSILIHQEEPGDLTPRPRSRLQNAARVLSSYRIPSPRTPSGFNIYDDSLPAQVQPQTPDHVPEARHQSRYHPSYTVPERANRVRRFFSIDGQEDGMLSEPGYRGLYGGLENGNDSTLWDEGARRNNAELRSWRARREDSEELIYTPERE